MISIDIDITADPELKASTIVRFTNRLNTTELRNFSGVISDICGLLESIEAITSGSGTSKAALPAAQKTKTK